MIFAGVLLALAGAFGLVIIACPAWAPRWQPGAAHGAIGVAGFAALLLGLGGPPRGVAMGAGHFATFAAWLFAFALLMALPLAGARLRRRPPPMLAIGLHVTLAIAGLTILGVYLTLPP